MSFAVCQRNAFGDETEVSISGSSSTVDHPAVVNIYLPMSSRPPSRIDLVEVAWVVITLSETQTVRFVDKEVEVVIVPETRSYRVSVAVATLRATQLVRLDGRKCENLQVDGCDKCAIIRLFALQESCLHIEAALARLGPCLIAFLCNSCTSNSCSNHEFEGIVTNGGRKRCHRWKVLMLTFSCFLSGWQPDHHESLLELCA